jgi:hypothetical protein
MTRTTVDPLDRCLAARPGRWWGEAPELHQVFAERIDAFNSKRATLQRCRAVVYGLPRPWSLARQGTGSAAFQPSLP